MSEDSRFEAKRRGYRRYSNRLGRPRFYVFFMLLAPSSTVIISFGIGHGWAGMSWALAYALALTGLFLWICRKKSSGPWCWR